MFQFSTLKQLIRTNHDRCVIVEGGEPKYVLLAFDEYQQLQKNGEHSIVGENSQGVDTAERANHELQEIWELGEHDSEPNKKVTAISIEDLPF